MKQKVYQYSIDDLAENEGHSTKSPFSIEVGVAETIGWKVITGDTVKKDDLILSVPIDKTYIDLHAPVSGRIKVLIPYDTDYYKEYTFYTSLEIKWDTKIIEIIENERN